MVGIYKITNKINGKVYIGESFNIENRFETHKADLINGTHNRKLNKDVKTYGIDSFEFTVEKELNISHLSIFKQNIILLVYEDIFIKKYNSVYNGYNCQFTLQFVRDGKKKTIDTGLRLNTINKIIDIVYGTISINNNEYSLEYERSFRKSNGYSDISAISLLKSKMRLRYNNYDFMNDVFNIIDDNRYSILHIYELYANLNSLPTKERELMSSNFMKSLGVLKKFLNRYKYALSESISVLSDLSMLSKDIYIVDFEEEQDWDCEYLKVYKALSKDILIDYDIGEADVILDAFTCCSWYLIDCVDKIPDEEFNDMIRDRVNILMEDVDIYPSYSKDREEELDNYLANSIIEEYYCEDNGFYE